MVKNIFSLLNDDNKYLVEIFKLKYGRFNVWNLARIPKSFGFYRALCKSIIIIRPYRWINHYNPRFTHFKGHHWLF